jgi:hypothetical protein
MQWYPGPEGDQRIWYEADDIEQIAEDELRRAGLMPTPVNPVPDLERFIEGHLKVDLDQYAQLPDDVLGLTQFEPARRPKISISSALTAAAEEGPPKPGRLGRWRATLAHEAGHVLLHRYLFDPEFAPLSNGRPADNPVDRTGLMRCLHRDIDTTPTGISDWNKQRRTKDWREVQANRAMAALLMPRGTFKRLAFQQMAQLQIVDPQADTPDADNLAAALAETCSVSRQAAAIRLRTVQVIRRG